MPFTKIQSAILVLISKAFAEGEASIRVSRVSIIIIIIIINGYFHLGILQTGSLKSIVYNPTSTSEGRKEDQSNDEVRTSYNLIAASLLELT
jgi:hypothetical protein